MQVIFNDFPGVYTSKPITPYQVEVDGTTTYTRYTDGSHKGGYRRVYKKTTDTVVLANKKYYRKETETHFSELHGYCVGANLPKTEDIYEFKELVAINESEKQLIFRSTVSGGLTTNEKAWDLWANRKTATYYPVNVQIGIKPDSIG